MKLYKFSFDGQIGNNVIDVDTNSEYFIGIPNLNEEFTTVKLRDGETELSSFENKDGYDLYQFNEGNDALRRNLKATKVYDKPALSADSFTTTDIGLTYIFSTNFINSIDVSSDNRPENCFVDVYNGETFVGRIEYTCTGHSAPSKFKGFAFRAVSEVPDGVFYGFRYVKSTLNDARTIQTRQLSTDSYNLTYNYPTVGTPDPLHKITTTFLSPAESSIEKTDILVICHKSNIAEVGNSAQDIVGIVENSGKVLTPYPQATINGKKFDVLSNNTCISADAIVEGKTRLGHLVVKWDDSLSATVIDSEGPGTQWDNNQINLNAIRISSPVEILNYTMTPIRLTTTVEGMENMDVWVLGYVNLT